MGLLFPLVVESHGIFEAILVNLGNFMTNSEGLLGRCRVAIP
jgi:hypothetical protein